LPGRPGAAGPWDPALFRDPDTKQWYLYYGSSNIYPIYGIQLDAAHRLKYQGQPKELIRLHPEQHGWERFGQDHRDSTIKPYAEGAWMTKHAGRYYLQYAAPGTEYNVYANGTYVGQHPLGPFSYAPYNPVSYKPGGFMTGAGHGNTFQDVYGNWWNTGTPWLAINWTFERRIAMFPSGFDADGQLYADTRFGDFPHYLPRKTWHDRGELFTGWMLLSYRKPVTASSTRDTFPATNVTDEDRKTFWVADRNHPGQWLTIDLGPGRTVRAVQVNYVDYRSNIFVSDASVYTQFRLLHSTDGKQWQVIADLSREKRDRPNAYIELPRPVRTRYIRYEHGYVASPNLAIGDIRVFGTGPGKPPRLPSGVRIERGTDQRNAVISWNAVGGAVGYNVVWGLKPGKLYQTYQVFAAPNPRLELRALTVGQDYWVALEAFNETGVSPLSRPVYVR
jgi:hypothetical protein